MNNDFIKFLGTAGARFVVSRQMRSSAGMWCRLHGKNLLIDPGPGTLVKCFSSKPKLEPKSLDAIILTHRHIDHSTDMNVMVEAMTEGTFCQRGNVFLPEDALLEEPVLFQYLRKAVNELTILEENKKYFLGPELTLNTPKKLEHSVETYGLCIKTPSIVVSLIADTKYFNDISSYYYGDVLILNVVLYNPVQHENVKHLDLDSARIVIREVKPKIAILTHFGRTMLKQKPWKIAKRLTEETGIKVVAAYDGFKLSLEP